MRILGPMLLTGAVASGAVVLSLFIDPRERPTPTEPIVAASAQDTAPRTLPLVPLVAAQGIDVARLDALGPLRVGGSLAGHSLLACRTNAVVPRIHPAVLRPVMSEEHRIARRTIAALSLDPACLEDLTAIVRDRREALATASAALGAANAEVRARLAATVDEGLLEALTATVGERAPEVAGWLASQGASRTGS